MAKSKSQLDELIKDLKKLINREPQNLWRSHAETILQDTIDFADNLGTGSIRGIDNLVYVSASSDFPGTPGDGTRTLAANTIYQIAGDIDLGSDRLRMGSNTILQGISPIVDTLTTNNADYLISGSETNLLRNIGLQNDGGTIWVWSGSANIYFAVADRVIFKNSPMVADISNAKTISLIKNTVLDVDQGYKFNLDPTSNSGSNVRIEGMIALNAGAGGPGYKTLDFHEGRVRAVHISNNRFEASSGSVHLNINTGSLSYVPSQGGFIVTNNEFCGCTGSIPLSGTTVFDRNVLFKNNVNILDTNNNVEFYYSNNSTETQIVLNEWHTLSGSYQFDIEEDTQRWDIVNGNQLQFLGVVNREGRRKLVQFSISVNRTGGSGTRNGEVALFKNNVLIPRSVSQFITDNRGRTVTGLTYISLEEGDAVDIRIRNTENDAEFTVAAAKIVVTG